MFTCKGAFKADTMDELLQLVAQHLRERHAIQKPTATIMNYVAKKARM